VDYECAPELITVNERREMTELKIVGRVIKVSKEGWGFISSKQIEFTRIFFHWTALRQDTIPFLELKTGMHVEFTPLKIDGKGYRAMHVRVIEKPVKKEEEADEVSTLSE
jgi:cold shock CspA family protein